LNEDPSPIILEDDLEAAEKLRAGCKRLLAEVGKVIVGQPDTVRGVLTALFAGGHVLLEGVPGLGKTLLVRTLAQALDLGFNRVQFTPDLMPADITGTTLIAEAPDGSREFKFQPGPLFAQIVLADEINRATPKTQSALLEAMQEHAVTVGGVTRPLGEPFFVLATQNPIEQEGTYPLPEAQLDRFLVKLVVPFPTRAELNGVLDRTTTAAPPAASKVMDAAAVLAGMQLVREVLVAGPVQDYAVRLLLATHPKGDGATADAGRYLRAGASPRGAQAMILAGKVRALLHGRFNVGFEDIRAGFLPALRHRVMTNYHAEAEGVTPDDVIARLLQLVPREESERG
jgi:MoxR-like ATPase